MGIWGHRILRTWPYICNAKRELEELKQSTVPGCCTPCLQLRLGWAAAVHKLSRRTAKFQSAVASCDVLRPLFI